MSLSESDQEWLAEVQRVAGQIESGEVEAPESIRRSIAYILEDPERVIAECEAALADPDIRASLDEHLAREARGEPEPMYTTEEVLRHLRERGLDLEADEEDRTP
jgi:hypothetical protein